MKRIAPLVFLGAVALVSIVHCSEPVHQCGLDVSCGDPGALAGKVAPGPPNASGTDSNNNTNKGADASTSTLCPNPVNPTGTGCTISFTKDILGKKLGAAGTWGCAASGCHDPQGGSPPKIDVNDPATTYANLYHSGTGAKPYVNPCSKVDGDSEIMGNLANPSTAGDHMPKGNPALPTQADIDMIVKPWVECGAPLN